MTQNNQLAGDDPLITRLIAASAAAALAIRQLSQEEHTSLSEHYLEPMKLVASEAEDAAAALCKTLAAGVNANLENTLQMRSMTETTAEKSLRDRYYDIHNALQNPIADLAAVGAILRKWYVDICQDAAMRQLTGQEWSEMSFLIHTQADLIEKVNGIFIADSQQAA